MRGASCIFGLNFFSSRNIAVNHAKLSYYNHFSGAIVFAMPAWLRFRMRYPILASIPTQPEPDIENRENLYHIQSIQRDNDTSVRQNTLFPWANWDAPTR